VNLVKFPVAPPKVKETNIEAINFLAELLTEAKAGNLTHFIMMYRDDEGNYSQCYTGSNNLIEDAGMLTGMLHRVNIRMDS